MLRTLTVLAGTAVLAAALGAPAHATEPVDTVVAAVEKVANGVDVPGGGTVIGGGGGVRGRSAVIGAVTIKHQPTLGDTAPYYVLKGALADPNQWTCDGGGDAATYRVTCVPVPLVLPVAYHCDVLHADATTHSAAASVRTTMHCDGDDTPEAQTDTVYGVGGYDVVMAVDTRAVTRFTCIVDNGAGDYITRCGDPGYVGVE